MLRSFSLLSAVGLCAMSVAADAAEVVKMRLGRHPEFTRVVFELDAPAGYSLEQSTLPGGGTNLIVTLDASATDREMELRKAWVNRVSLSGDGSRSVARVELSASGLRVREMILASPPRIVLDVLAPVSIGATASSTKGSTKSASTPSSKPSSKPTSSASQPSATAPGAGAGSASTSIAANKASRQSAKGTMSITTRSQGGAVVPPVASVNHAANSAAPRAAIRPRVAPAARPAATPKPQIKPNKVAVSQGSRPGASVAAKASPAAQLAAIQRVTTSVTTPIRTPAKTPPPPARKKPALRPSAMPAAPAAIPQAASNSLFTATHIGGGLALLGLVGGGAFFMLRRRSGEELLAGDDFEPDPLSADNPFASPGDDTAVVSATADDAADQSVPHPPPDEVEANVVDEFGSADDSDIPVPKVSADAGTKEGLFDSSGAQTLSANATNEPGAASAEAAGDNMETHGDSTINAGSGAMPPIPGADLGDSSEMMRMLREFEQRMASLESRLDEVTESKERLERQVTAQTEELRVQRAAIARTQRALRNLTRPDDDVATEPARREPNP